MLKGDFYTGQIQLIPLAGGQARTVIVKGYVNFNSLVWAPDSKSVFVGTSGPNGAVLLRVDLNGGRKSYRGSASLEELGAYFLPTGATSPCSVKARKQTYG